MLCLRSKKMRAKLHKRPTSTVIKPSWSFGLWPNTRKPKVKACGVLGPKPEPNGFPACTFEDLRHIYINSETLRSKLSKPVSSRFQTFQALTPARRNPESTTAIYCPNLDTPKVLAPTVLRCGAGRTPPASRNACFCCLYSSQSASFDARLYVLSQGPGSLYPSQSLRCQKNM